MPSLANFTDFMALTGPNVLTPIDEVLNEAQQRNYGVLTRLLKGRGKNEILQGGSKITDHVMFEVGNTFGHYSPNDEFSAQQPQVTKTLEIRWRFAHDHMAWNDQLYELNVPDGVTEDAQKVKYKDLRKVIHQRLWTSMFKGMDADMWLSPIGQYSEMEGADGEIPYSIPAFITEDTTNYHYNGWTNVMGLDPASNEKWRNQVSNYDSAHTLGDPDGDGDGVLDAFDDMWQLVQFEGPGEKQEHFNDTNMNREFIACSRRGLNRYKRELRASNANLVSHQDSAYNKPTYSSVPFQYCSALDTAEIFDPSSSGTAGTELTATVVGPRFFFINGEHLKPVYHKRRYMKVHKPRQPDRQWFSWVQPVDSWYNLFCHSRQRQGIVAPV